MNKNKTKKTKKTKKTHFAKFKRTRKSHKKQIKHIKNTTPYADNFISKKIYSFLKQENTPPTNLEIVSHTLEKYQSYSPSILDRLEGLHKGITDVFGCKSNSIEDFLMASTFVDKNDMQEYDLKIKVGINNDGTPICRNWNSKSAIQTLLSNLKYSKTIKCNQIVAPLQRNSNCWFNSFFMNFFISDKGRTFFRKFRQCMILGTTFDNHPISNRKLKKPLFLLNMAIESSYNTGNLPKELALGSVMNTNNLINYIYHSLTLQQKRNNLDITPSTYANNPVNYYIGLTNLLNKDTINILELDNYNEFFLLTKFFKKLDNYKIPEVIILNIYDEESISIKDKKLSFRIDNTVYDLDSVVMRDTSMKHFCSLLTCNGKDYAFEGSSFKRISPFHWRNMLNRDKKFTFNGMASQVKMYWNFKKGYQQLFYYRKN